MINHQELADNAKEANIAADFARAAEAKAKEAKVAADEALAQAKEEADKDPAVIAATNVVEEAVKTHDAAFYDFTIAKSGNKFAASRKLEKTNVAHQAAQYAVNAACMNIPAYKDAHQKAGAALDTYTAALDASRDAIAKEECANRFAFCGLAVILDRAAAHSAILSHAAAAKVLTIANEIPALEAANKVAGRSVNYNHIGDNDLTSAHQAAYDAGQIAVSRADLAVRLSKAAYYAATAGTSSRVSGGFKMRTTADTLEEIKKEHGQ